MKCAVIGGSVLPPCFCEEQREQCEALGEWMAQRGIEVLTGACDGYPYMVSKGAMRAGGKVTGYSPAITAEEHLSRYEHPVDAVTDMVFLTEFPNDSFMQRMLARSLPLMGDCDVALCLEGSWGTLMELIAAVCLSKPITVVKELGGVAAKFEAYYKEIQAECQHPFSAKLFAVDTLAEAKDQLAGLLAS